MLASPQLGFTVATTSAEDLEDLADLADLTAVRGLIESAALDRAG